MKSPTIEYANAKDGSRIAFSKHGSGPPLLFVRGWISHLDIFWEDPEYRTFFESLGYHFTVYRYDCRGNGLSSREASDYSWNALVSDLHAVIEHESLAEFDLWGTTFGAIIAAIYTAQNPERVRSLILDGSYVRGKEITSFVKRLLLVQSLKRFPEMAHLLLSRATSPSNRNVIYRMPETVLQIINPDVSSKLYSLGFKANISGLASKIEKRTLVLHRRNSQSIPFSLGQQLSNIMPNARFVALEGTAHNLWEENSYQPLKEMFEFLEVENFETDIEKFKNKIDNTGRPSKRISAILYADVEKYTENMARDEGVTFENLASKLDTLHEFVVRNGGTVHHEAGDALLAEFSSASDSVNCAVRFQSFMQNGRVAEDQTRFRIGINIGDVINDRGSIYGTAVNVAQRLQSECEPGNVAISRSVYDAISGSGNISNEIRYIGKKEFKNVPFPIEVFSIIADGTSSENIVPILSVGL
jgi:class 3 adenylate cyclase